MDMLKTLGDVNICIWGSIPLSTYGSPTNDQEGKRAIKRLKRTQAFLTQTVLSPMWAMAQKFNNN